LRTFSPEKILPNDQLAVEKLGLDKQNAPAKGAAGKIQKTHNFFEKRD